MVVNITCLRGSVAPTPQVSPPSIHFPFVLDHVRGRTWISTTDDLLLARTILSVPQLDLPSCQNVYDFLRPFTFIMRNNGITSDGDSLVVVLPEYDMVTEYLGKVMFQCRWPFLSDFDMDEHTELIRYLYITRNHFLLELIDRNHVILVPVDSDNETTSEE